MAKQSIDVRKSGADSRAVLDALTPLIGITAPDINATYIGQIYVDTVAGIVYVSVKKGSETPADDWQSVTNPAV